MSPTVQRITERHGRGVVVRGDDIDTDRIIPARYMTSIRFAGLEKHVFQDVRFDADGRPLGHPFDDPRFAGASVLVVNKNFGCGSSREHAPQALLRWGIRAIVGESFAEIFFGNCIALGIPAVTASEADVTRLMAAVEADPSQTVAIDLVGGLVRWEGGEAPARIPEGARRQLAEGTWDATGVLLEAREAILATANRLPY
jgi:3-isopropylmalate/(R)-2-methylmalate dehydratase small subunit